MLDLSLKMLPFVCLWRRTRGHFRIATYILVILAAQVGAGFSGGCHRSDDSTPAKEQACKDTAHQIAQAHARCGDDYEKILDEALSALNNCNGVDAIRDESELRGKCFSELQTMTCTDLLIGEIPASCDKQIIFYE